jgi:glycosyltransferase involved in cell wall biosynthesis
VPAAHEPRGFVVDFLERESSRLADRLIAPSAYMAEWARTRWRLDRDIDVMFNCYDESVGGPRRVVVHEGPFEHLIFFGRLETRKGLHLFVSAIAESDTLRNHVKKVTFLGRHSRVNDRPSEQFLAEALAALPWLETEIKSDLGSLEALAWIQSQQHALVVTPSLGDNLPYGAVELHSRRIPFLSTQIGGIPEIVGERNRHQLAPAAVDGIRQVLERTCADGSLVVDYSCGYDPREANAAHVAIVKELLATPRPAPAASAAGVNIVVTDAASADDAASVQAGLAHRGHGTRSATSAGRRFPSGRPRAGRSPPSSSTRRSRLTPHSSGPC